MSVDQYKKEVGMMNLEKLIESREAKTIVIFPIDDKELLYRYEQLYTGAVNDVLREFCLLDQALPGHIVPLREYRTIAGFAFTVKSSNKRAAVESNGNEKVKPASKEWSANLHPALTK